VVQGVERALLPPPRVRGDGRGAVAGGPAALAHVAGSPDRLVLAAARRSANPAAAAAAPSTAWSRPPVAGSRCCVRAAGVAAGFAAVPVMWRAVRRARAMIVTVGLNPPAVANTEPSAT